MPSSKPSLRADDDTSQRPSHAPATPFDDGNYGTRIVPRDRGPEIRHDQTREEIERGVHNEVDDALGEVLNQPDAGEYPQNDVLGQWPTEEPQEDETEQVEA